MWLDPKLAAWVIRSNKPMDRLCSHWARNVIGTVNSDATFLQAWHWSCMREMMNEWRVSVNSLLSTVSVSAVCMGGVTIISYWLTLHSPLLHSLFTLSTLPRHHHYKCWLTLSEWQASMWHTNRGSDRTMKAHHNKQGGATDKIRQKGKVWYGKAWLNTKIDCQSQVNWVTSDEWMMMEEWKIEWHQRDEIVHRVESHCRQCMGWCDFNDSDETSRLMNMIEWTQLHSTNEQMHVWSRCVNITPTKLVNTTNRRAARRHPFQHVINRQRLPNSTSAYVSWNYIEPTTHFI